MTDFKNIHPLRLAVYFVSVIIFSMLFMHPAFVAVSLILSTAAACCTDRGAIGNMRVMLPFALIIALANPLFNGSGNTVLFSIWKIRYTLQSLFYGVILACIFVCGINWFFRLGKNMDSDKMIYLFGGRLPSVCTVMTMSLSLIPLFLDKYRDIYRAQKVLTGGKDKMKTAFICFNRAVSYAFEHAVNMTFSMRNRGFGTGRQTRYIKYKFTPISRRLICFTLIADFIIATLRMPVAVGIQIVPEIIFNKFTFLNVAGLMRFILLLSVPAVFYIYKEIKWESLKSKI